MYPKPEKSHRLAAKAGKKASLADYRRVQSALAIHRDQDLCVFCWFLLGVKKKRADIHHVYSRGKDAGDWREHYTSLACTCKMHHAIALPIQNPGGNPALAWVEYCLTQANESPINKEFRHVAE